MPPRLRQTVSRRIATQRPRKVPHGSTRHTATRHNLLNVHDAQHRLMVRILAALPQLDYQRRRPSLAQSDVAHDPRTLRRVLTWPVLSTENGPPPGGEGSVVRTKELSGG